MLQPMRIGFSGIGCCNNGLGCSCGGTCMKCRMRATGPTPVAGLHARFVRALAGLRGLGSPGGPSPGIGAAVNLPAMTTPPMQALRANQPDMKYIRIPEGEQGTVATLKLMKQLVLSPWGAHNPQVALLAREIIRHVGSKDYVAEAKAIYNYVKSHVRYRLDPVALEWLQTPLYTLQTQQGDCDDHSTLIASLALAAGQRAAFRTVKGDPDRPDAWSHVYAVIGVQQGGDTLWLPADTTQQQADLGWDPPEAKLYGMATWVIDPDVTVEDQQWLT